MSTRHVVIVGGGASGALLAAHLLRDRDAGIRVTVIEPSPRLGRGLAFGTSSPSHLLNARARSMSGFGDRPEDFVEWLAANAPGGGRGESYAERRLYAHYLEDRLRPWSVAEGDGRLMHIRGVAVDVVEFADRVRLDLADGTAVVGQAAVLAIGHGLQPPLPLPLPAAPDGDVLILGTGLGMVDEVLSLLDAGHSGQIVALSRRGLLPQPHGRRGEMRLDAADIPLGTHLSYLTRWLRDEVRAQVRAGVAWSDIIDALRPHVPEIWANLPLETRRRFLRHARPWWDTHRHRMAPEVARRITEARLSGRLRVHAGHIVELEETSAGTRALWRSRGSRGRHAGCFAAVFHCTGPRRGPLTRDRLLARLVATGAVRQDPLELGIEVAPALAVMKGAGLQASARLFAVGPITAPSAWETYAIPEIRGQCDKVAGMLRAILQGNRPPRKPPGVSRRRIDAQGAAVEAENWEAGRIPALPPQHWP